MMPRMHSSGLERRDDRVRVGAITALVHPGSIPARSKGRRKGRCCLQERSKRVDESDSLAPICRAVACGAQRRPRDLRRGRCFPDADAGDRRGARGWRRGRGACWLRRARQAQGFARPEDRVPCVGLGYMTCRTRARMRLSWLAARACASSRSPVSEGRHRCRRRSCWIRPRGGARLR